MKGYKVFNPDWTCKGMKYEVGKTYEYKGEIELCEAGYHFCRRLTDCFNFYRFDPNNKVAEIEALGIVHTSGKSVTDRIRIVRELSWYEVLDLCNAGSFNTGCFNTGDRNAGSFNAGSFNFRFNDGEAWIFSGFFGREDVLSDINETTSKITRVCSTKSGRNLTLTSASRRDK